ncbi:MAG: hypothetical protein KatS3mg049_1491 [Caldilinea sp.]|jgi:hypothetical protein|nr:MAG: hypothetical protein KatS3mg049_1491 [Caldilinea sp.]
MRDIGLPALAHLPVSMCKPMVITNFFEEHIDHSNNQEVFS